MPIIRYEERAARYLRTAIKDIRLFSDDVTKIFRTHGAIFDASSLDRKNRSRLYHLIRSAMTMVERATRELHLDQTTWGIEEEYIKKSIKEIEIAEANLRYDPSEEEIEGRLMRIVQELNEVDAMGKDERRHITALTQLLLYATKRLHSILVLFRKGNNETEERVTAVLNGIAQTLAHVLQEIGYEVEKDEHLRDDLTPILQGVLRVDKKLHGNDPRVILKNHYVPSALRKLGEVEFHLEHALLMF